MGKYYNQLHIYLPKSAFLYFIKFFCPDLTKRRPHSLVLFLSRWQVNFVMRIDSLGRGEISGARSAFVSDRTVCDSLHLSWYLSSIFHLLLPPHHHHLPPPSWQFVVFVDVKRCRSTKTQSSVSAKEIRRWVIWDFSKPQVIQSLSAWQHWLCWLCISKQRERLGVHWFQQHSSTDPPTSIFIFLVRSNSVSFWRVFCIDNERCRSEWICDTSRVWQIPLAVLISPHLLSVPGGC